MAIVRWTPFSAVTALERDMQTMLDRLMPDRPVSRQFFEWRPAVDMTREEGELLIRAEVPGIELEDLDIEIEDNVLHIKGERTVEKEVDEGIDTSQSASTEASLVTSSSPKASIPTSSTLPTELGS